MRAIKNLLKKFLPERHIESYRRRRAVRAYMRSLSYDIYDRQKKLRIEELEGRILARRPSLTHRLMKDLLERMDVVMEGFHRQLEGVRTRHGTELRALREDVESLRAALEALRGEIELSAGRPAPEEFPEEQRAEGREAPATLTQALD